MHQVKIEMLYIGCYGLATGRNYAASGAKVWKAVAPLAKI